MTFNYFKPPNFQDHPIILGDIEKCYNFQVGEGQGSHQMI